MTGTAADDRTHPGDAGTGIVDVNALIPSGAGGLARVDRERTRVGVALALSRHADALRGDPLTGSRLAIEAASDPENGMEPVAVIAPTSARAVADVPEHARAGARGFWLGTASWYGAATTASAATDALLAAVARTGRPLLVPIAAWGDATAIGARTADLGMPVVLVGAHYTHIVDDLAAADRYAHLHIETSALAHLGAIERAVATIGAERILFGSGMPERPPSAPLNAIVSAAIDDADKRSILGGNARRLFGLPDAEIRIPAALDVRVAQGTASVDVHGHLPPVPWDVPDLDASSLSRSQTARGIGRTVVSSIEAITADRARGNEATVAACAAEPSLLGYIVADPNDVAATADELRRSRDAPGIVGAKVHCEWSAADTSSREVAALFEVLATDGRPVLIHVAGPDWPAAMRRIVARHPRLPIIAAHGGPGAPSVAMAEIARDSDNLRIELASSFASLTEVRRMVEVAGPERFLFGTDVPLLEPAFVLGTYADAALTPHDTPDVFGDEAARILMSAA